jgi:hypothetical protein
MTGVIGAIIAGIFSVVVALIYKDLMGKIWEFLKRHWKLLLSIFIILIVIGSFCWCKTRPSLSINLKGGAIVDMEQQITGKFAHIPKDCTVWVVVHIGDWYYSQRAPNIDYENGNWTCDVRFGGADNDGDEFEIIVVFADMDAYKVLAPDDEGALPSFSAFPFEGVTVKDRVTVRRAIWIRDIDDPTPYHDMPTPTPNSDKTSVTFTYPANNVDVDRYELVKGRFANIPDGQYLWVIVQVDDLYFAHEVKTINTGSTWEQYVMIGQADEDGKSFDLIAVLVNSTAHEMLAEWRDNYDHENPDDMQSLPAGTTPYDTITVTRKINEPSITITSHTNNTHVDRYEWINGTSQNIPEGQELWIVVHEGSLYFPMSDRVPRNTNGTWAYYTTIGKENDFEKSFDIITVLANSTAQATVQNWYQKNASEPYDLESLPAGMTSYNTITVTRRNETR